jgi:hypothetical protein
MRAADQLILGSILALGGALLLKVESILRPNDDEGIAEKLSAIVIYFTGIVLGFVGIWGLF